MPRCTPKITDSIYPWQVVTVRDGRGRFFFTGGAGQGRQSTGWGRGLNLRGRGTYYVYQLIEIICYSRGNQLICIASSEVSQIYSIFIINIVIVIMIIVQCCHIVSLWVAWIGRIRECHLYCAPPLPRSFDHFCGAGPQGCFTGRGGNW